MVTATSEETQLALGPGKRVPRPEGKPGRAGPVDESSLLREMTGAIAGAKTVQDAIELVLREIVASLERGDTVKLSSFGSFGIRDKGQRIGRNPKTGQEVPITPRRVLVFRASNIMKQRINDALSRRKAAE